VRGGRQMRWLDGGDEDRRGLEEIFARTDRV
jgi:hypothetical protein